MDADFFPVARKFLLRVVPQSARELRELRARAARIPDPAIRREALSSIALKDFHVHGGCILATFLTPESARRYVRLVAVFETAVDYLDNLCDRLGSADEEDFRSLHQALSDAVDPAAGTHAYFARRQSDDGGYLTSLVEESQRLFAALPGYAAVQPWVARVTAGYNELQSIKHLPAGERERRCAAAFGQVASDLRWWEGAAASGSTMPTFALAFAATQPCDAATAETIYQAYFPYISAFHILLDYFIDQAEDRAHGELNFVACYPDRTAARQGMERIGATALARAQATPHAIEHAFAVRAMCGFYCSRPKVAQQGLEPDARAIAQAVGVDLGAPWAPRARALVAPLLRLYRRVIQA